jgi:ribA/ribD-fused uncharacterized protein
MPHEINFYRNKDTWGFMSNFYRSTIHIGGTTYKTVEHYYQSQKALLVEHRVWIMTAPTPYLAAVAGRALREDRGEIELDSWNANKVQFMREGLMAKFNQHSDLREKLLATEDWDIHEDSPTDKFWGKKGQDMLGKLLMEIRERLRSLDGA